MKIKITDKQINREPSFGILLSRKFVLVFPLQNFILAVSYFSPYTGSLSNSFLRLFPTFSQISLYFPNNLSPFIKRDTYLVPSKFFLYALIFGRYIHKI